MAKEENGKKLSEMEQFLVDSGLMVAEIAPENIPSFNQGGKGWKKQIPLKAQKILYDIAVGYRKFEIKTISLEMVEKAGITLDSFLNRLDERELLVAKLSKDGSGLAVVADRTDPLQGEAEERRISTLASRMRNSTFGSGHSKEWLMQRDPKGYQKALEVNRKLKK